MRSENDDQVTDSQDQWSFAVMGNCEAEIQIVGPLKAVGIYPVFRATQRLSSGPRVFSSTRNARWLL